MAGTVTYSKDKIRNGNELVEEHTWDCIGDATNGAIPDKESDDVITGWLAEAETNPGTPAPVADYDITLSNANGVDVLGGEGADRSATVSQAILPKIGNGYGEKFVDSKLTLAVSNTTSGSGTTSFKIRVRKGSY